MGSIPQLSILKGVTSKHPSQVERLHRLFETNASNVPNEKAIIYKDVQHCKTYTMSFHELEESSNKLARAILSLTQEAGCNADGDYVVAVGLAPTHNLIATLLAVWKAGAAYLPLDYNAPRDRVRHIMTEAKPVLVITENDKDDDMYGNCKRVSISRLMHEASTMSSDVISTPEMLASHIENPVVIILYTSGSTGIPKGVRILTSAVLNRLQWQWREFPYSATEVNCAFKTALTFVDSVSEIWGPLLHCHPRTVIVIPREVTKDPQQLICMLDLYKIERLVLVPTLLRAMLMYLSLSKDKHLRSLRLWVCSGESLPVALANQFLEVFKADRHTLCNFYGSTEVMGDVTYHAMRDFPDVCFNGKVPIGVPLDNTAVYLLDKNLKPVPLGSMGELYAAGRNLAAGYVNKRDADRFVTNPHTVDPDYNTMYRTGDFAKIVKGVLVFEGRTDSQIKVRGHRVDMSEIEAAISKIDKVKKGVVLCYKPGEIKQAVLSFVLLEGNSQLCEKEIETILQNTLPPYSIPQVILISELPLLVNGKVDRQTLLRMYEERYIDCDEGLFEFDYSGLSTEQLTKAECLFKTVATVLGSAIRGKISAKANFYTLGGNSLNSVYTVTKLRDQGYIISITDFISAENLGQVINKLQHEDEADSKDVIGTSKHNYTTELLNQSHKKEVYRVITDSFYEKADLERWIEPPLTPTAYVELLDQLWSALVDKKLSLVVKSTHGQIIGAALNFDAHDEPEVTITSKLMIVFNFLEYLEGPIRDNMLPQGKGKVLHSFMMGTAKELSAAENVQVIELMEEEILGLAKSRGFTGILTTNTNPLTQQLGTDVFNYRVMHDYQVNEYVAADGTRPFAKAPDSQRTVVSWKLIR